MKYSETGIKGLWVIEPQRFGDKRGYFMETFRLDEFTLATGTDVSFVQDNESLFVAGSAPRPPFPKRLILTGKTRQGLNGAGTRRSC